MGNKSVVQSSPEVLGGTPVFAGTRVPVQTLFHYLEAGDSLDDFLRDFPTVKREQAQEVLELSKQALIRSRDEAAS
ncbi:MAG: hypothetical protein KatS3mg081_1369 [Gemmatimonadales bacterium]|nr:MAG: hypothetical protein KatS3mg081_1369 [Gemmatimonadales bacterium]